MSPSYICLCCSKILTFSSFSNYFVYYIYYTCQLGLRMFSPPVFRNPPMQCGKTYLWCPEWNQWNWVVGELICFYFAGESEPTFSSQCIESTVGRSLFLSYSVMRCVW